MNCHGPEARALRRAAEAGLAVPVVYNCGGYERVETVDLLEQAPGGLVDLVDLHPPVGAGRNHAMPGFAERNAGDNAHTNQGQNDRQQIVRRQ